MTTSRNWRASALMVLLVLTSCGGSNPPNTVVEGVVQKITRTRPACFKILSVFGACPEYYGFEFRSNTSETWWGHLGVSRADEDDLRRIISERVTFRCYRAADEKSERRCTEALSSLTWNGREILRK